MNRGEMEQILQVVMDLMDLLTPHVNEPDQKDWIDLIDEDQVLQEETIVADWNVTEIKSNPLEQKGE